MTGDGINWACMRVVWRQAGICVLLVAVGLIHFVQSRTELEKGVHERAEVSVVDRRIFKNIAIGDAAIHVDGRSPLKKLNVLLRQVIAENLNCISQHLI